MKKQLVFASLSFLLLLPLTATKVSAHAGGGPPFLLINGKYAQTNPYFLGGPDVPVSQDTSPVTTVVNQPISFEIDLSQLQVPPDIAKASTFRWTWEDGDKSYEYGTKLSHTYTKVGSHLMTLDVKAPQEQDWLTLDTVQINSVPTATYQLPTGTIFVQPGQLLSKSPITFANQATADPSTKVASTDWYADGQKFSNKQSITKSYSDSDFADYIFLKVVDGNGISSDAAIQVAADNSVISVSNLDPKNVNVPTISQAKQVSSSQQAIKPQFLIFGIVSLIVIVLGVFVARRKKQ